jgi:hypothetical protein
VKKSILFIFSALLIGSSVYLLFRPPFTWLPEIGGWNKAVVDLSRLPTPVSDFILYHLSDVMWALALAETVYVVKKNLYLGVFTALGLTILFEVMQYSGIVRGTGDIWDVIFVAISLSIYYLIKKRRYQHEKRKKEEV